MSDSTPIQPTQAEITPERQRLIDLKASMPMRDELACAMFAAWVNVTVERLPGEFKQFDNPATMEAWGRVAGAARSYLEPAQPDLAQAAVAAALEGAAQTVDTLGDSAVTEALSTRLCCDGHMCGCQGADVGAYILHHIRALITAPQRDALQAVIDAAVAEARAEDAKKIEVFLRDVSLAETDMAIAAHPVVDLNQPEFNRLPLQLALMVKHILQNRQSALAQIGAKP